MAFWPGHSVMVPHVLTDKGRLIRRNTESGVMQYKAIQYTNTTPISPQLVIRERDPT